MNEQTRNLITAAEELLASIEKRWEGESERKRENSISPRQEEAMTALRAAIEDSKRNDAD